MSDRIRIGLEGCLAAPPAALAGGARFGLLMNQASVDREFRYACDLLHDRFPGQLTALFSPQHGVWGEQQANMVESPHGRYEPLDVPVHSLYSETRRPTPEMLADLDALVIDLQDVGTRVYTFAWTMLNCLHACAEADIDVIVLDRPNPLGGSVLEGPLLSPALYSFVGGASIPLRHGQTLGELALWLNHERSIGARLEVVPIQSWRREMLFEETGRSWVLPSPNMQRIETTLLYPGQVLLEGTNLSEGRGTTLPFEVVGAPFINPVALTRELSAGDHPGLRFRPVRFVPTFDKWRGHSCGGVAIHIVEAAAVRSVTMTVCLLAAVKRLCPQQLEWLPPPYEYEREKMPIDILFGNGRLRESLDSGQRLTKDDLQALVDVDAQQWHDQTRSFRLYD